MFHATSARLARLARQFRDRQLARQQQATAVYGWQVQRAGFATYRYRDPRFDTLRPRPGARSLAPAGGGRDD
jgi:hypothetical protein